jgi:hypothetical protein
MMKIRRKGSHFGRLLPITYRCVLFYCMVPAVNYTGCGLGGLKESSSLMCGFCLATSICRFGLHRSSLRSDTLSGWLWVLAVVAERIAGSGVTNGFNSVRLFSIPVTPVFR